MINLTSHILVRAPERLGTAISEAIAAVKNALAKRYGPPAAKVRWNTRHAFHYLFNDSQIKNGVAFDERFLNAALQLTACNSRNEEAGAFFSALEDYLQLARPAATAIPSVKQAMRMMLVELWDRGIILLPTVFGTGSHFKPLPVSNELIAFVAAYDPEKADKATGRGLSTDMRRMFFYMPRIIMATSWQTVEDVNLEEFSELQRAQRLFIAGKSSQPMTTSQVPWTLFLFEIKESFPGRASYDADRIKLYSLWTTSHRLDLDFTEFELEHANRPKEGRRLRKLWEKKPAVKAQAAVDFDALGRSSLHDDALKYFKEFKGATRPNVDWLEAPPVYPGREHVSCADTVAAWQEAMRAFLHHRRHVKGYESDKGTKSALGLLADYLFLYLPWWKDLYPSSHVALPAAPKDFTRYAFIYRSSVEPLSELPMVFPEMVKLRRTSKDSQYAALKQIQLFFKFVEAHFSEDPEIAGPDFRLPLFDEFDMPRVQKRSKTSKVVFPKNSYGYLIYYGYAVEAFGQYLLERCVTRTLSEAEKRQLASCRFIDAASFGYVPFVRFRGKLIAVTLVPNVFMWATRRVRTSASETSSVFIPHLTTLRLLMAAAEVGLRLAALRWLDMRTWDKDNTGASASEFSYEPREQYVYSLHVNTDKTGAMGWDTSIVFRVRALLLREQEFQASIDEEGMDAEVPYQKRPHSRFGNVLPLFRAAGSLQPISQTGYADYWVLYMIGFQSFLEKVTGSFVPMVKIQPTHPISPQGNEPKMTFDSQNVPYTAVSILAISTPHACRASFATNRQGILETSDIAQLIGHKDPHVTEYYQSPRAEDLKQKLEEGDRKLCEEAMFDKANAAYVRADSEGSALVRNFKQDRERAIGRFGFMPVMSMWSLVESESLDDEAMEALCNGPMSLVRFRETHICPVGEECPADIVQKIGGFRRCGLCPLALKCIDHLPAIAAKKNALMERIKYLTRQKDQLEGAGERQSVEALWEDLELDTNELLGWQLSEEILAKMFAEQQQSGRDVLYHAEQPDVVRRHLQRVVKQTGPTEFLLHRIAEANAFPSLQSPQVQAFAANLRRRLMAGRSVPELLTDVPGPDDVDIAASLLKTVMQVNKLSVADMSAKLNEEGPIVLSCNAPLQLGGAK